MMPLFRPAPSTRRAPLVALLGATQIIGWGTTFDMPAALGRPMAADLGVPLSVVMLGLAAMMGTGGLAGPAVGRALMRYGAAAVLSAGSLVMACGLFILAAATDVTSYGIAWVIVGLGGSMALTVGAHTAVTERRPQDARETIAGLMLVTGLSSTIFLPTLTVLDGLIGWRATLLVGAVLNLLVCAPLHWCALPSPAAPSVTEAVERRRSVFVPTARPELAFALIAFVLSVSAFVSFGLSPILPAVLGAKGLTPEHAVAVATSRGVIGVTARAVDVAAAGVVGPVASAIVAGAMTLAGFVLLAGASFDVWHASGFITAYAIGSGIMAVVRSTLPLAFFRREDYGLQMGRLALPQNMAVAFAPAAFAAFLDAGEVHALALVCVASSSLTVVALLGLAILRRSDRRRLQRTRTP